MRCTIAIGHPVLHPIVYCPVGYRISRVILSGLQSILFCYLHELLMRSFTRISPVLKFYLAKGLGKNSGTIQVAVK